MTRFLAPAKVNLTLRVVGRRADGYHLLHTVMTFFPLFDTLDITPTPMKEEGPLTFSCTPPVTDDPEKNLVLRAARLLHREAGVTAGAHLHLHKSLPHAAGLGGGSSDAASALLALSRMWGVNWPPTRLMALGVQLGADVPFFIGGQAALAEGIGERLTPLPHLPPLPMLLVNPREQLSTATVFKAFSEQLTNPPAAARFPPCLEAACRLEDLLPDLVNDLEGASRALCPAVTEVLGALESAGALAARMSGSGPTCFGLFADMEQVGHAARVIGREHPHWLVVGGLTRNTHPQMESDGRGP